MTGPNSPHETVDPDTREGVLNKAGHRCQWCGEKGPGAGGVATLHVHHAARDTDGIDEHDLKNLTAVCRRCHNWLHNQPSEDEVPVEISDDDLTVLLPQDFEIIQVLAAQGPIRTGDITEQLTPNLSVSAVRERMWMLMGLDHTVESRDQQIVDQDADTGEWGLPEQISNSARGRIPEDPQTLLKRVEDERVRQALDRGCDRDEVADVIDVCSRTTWHKEKRARAFDFPLEALDDKGGRPPTSETDESKDTVDSDEKDGQLRLDAATETSPEGSPHRDPAAEDSPRPSGDGQEGQPVTDGGNVRAHLRQAIQALEAIDEEL